MRLSIVFAVPTLAAAAASQSLVSSMNGNGLQHLGAAVAYAGFQDADTYADLLVGLPSTSGGEIRCISGLYLATGQGPNVLWSVTKGLLDGGSFGASIASVGNLTGNSASDFVVGCPGFRANPFSGINNGALFLIDGSTHAIAATIYGEPDTRLGTVVVNVFDQNGDGKAEIAATAPVVNAGTPSKVHVIQGTAWNGTASILTVPHSSLNSNGSDEFGDELAANFDLDGNGKKDLAIGSPRMFGGAGMVSFVSADGQFTTLAAYSAGIAGEHMGASVSGTHDYNGDGVVDFVVGAPLSSTSPYVEDGRVVVLSGAKLRTFTLPFELAVIPSGGTNAPDPLRFGTAVRASPDLNRDGVGDFLVGAPGWGTPIFAQRGAVYVFSGATLTRMGSIAGAGTERLGDRIYGAHQDVDGDFFPEFVASGSNSDNPFLGCGVLKLFRLFPTVPGTYCTAKTNSLGCAPAIGWSGSIPSVSTPSPSLITCYNLINQTSGLIFYSHAPNASAFQGGTLCVSAPYRRSPVQSSGGTTGGPDCSGTFAWDFNARIQSGVDPTLVAGAQIFSQCWARDTASPSTTSLSNGLRTLINP